jgi:hypothetical protein
MDMEIAQCSSKAFLHNVPPSRAPASPKSALKVRAVPGRVHGTAQLSVVVDMGMTNQFMYSEKKFVLRFVTRMIDLSTVEGTVGWDEDVIVRQALARASPAMKPSHPPKRQQRLKRPPPSHTALSINTQPNRPSPYPRQSHPAWRCRSWRS